jgi:hypothetical protein
MVPRNVCAISVVPVKRTKAARIILNFVIIFSSQLKISSYTASMI